MADVHLTFKSIIKKILGHQLVQLLDKTRQLINENVLNIVGIQRIKYFKNLYERLYGSSPFSINLKKGIRPDYKIGMAVLAHNRPEILDLCLDSLFQTNLHNYDITFLIQDDGSTDPKVREIIEKERDPQYKIIRDYTPKGHNSWGAAFNKAIHKLLEIDDFDIIGTCDSDAYFHPEWLDQTLKICLWAKKNHKSQILGPFSSFNSSDYIFHQILGTYTSPFGNYVVKKRMGALNYFFFKDDFLKLGYFPEDKDDETLMTAKFDKLKVRNFCTETSYIEHFGRISILDKWRPTAVGDNAAFAVKLARDGWVLPEKSTVAVPLLRLKNSLVLHIKFGGLGDHLFYSHLPRVAKETGRYKYVYISNHSALRNNEILRLVWENNPYIDGICDEPCLYPEVQRVREGCNFLDELMLLYDMDDGLRYHDPEIYYDPKIKPELAGKIIYDPNYISNAGSLTPETINEYFINNKIHIDLQMELRNRSIPLHNCDKWLDSKSLEDFCDIIYSCKQLYCLVTGTATLSSALNRSATVLYGNGVGKWFLHSKRNKYVEIN